MAEAVFQHLVNEAGLEKHIEVDSAGTGDWHVGNPAHQGTLTILQKNSILYDGRARHLMPEDLQSFNYIVTMDDENLRGVQRLQTAASTAHVAPLLDYGVKAKQAQIREVPDPYFNGGFETVYQLVQDGCAGLLDAIRREHNL